MLEDHANIGAELAQLAAAQVGDVAAVDADGAARGLLKQVDAADEGRLAGAGLADDAEDLPGLDGERDVVERAVGAGRAVEDFGYVCEFNHSQSSIARCFQMAFGVLKPIIDG